MNRGEGFSWGVRFDPRDIALGFNYIEAPTDEDTILQIFQIGLLIFNITLVWESNTEEDA